MKIYTQKAHVIDQQDQWIGLEKLPGAWVSHTFTTDEDSRRRTQFYQCNCFESAERLVCSLLQNNEEE